MAPAIKLFLVVLIALAGAGVSAKAETPGQYPHRVLILLSGNDALPWQAKIRQGIAEQLATYEAEYGDEGPEIHIESLDLYRDPAGENDTRLTEIAAKYDVSEFGLLLTEGIPAARLVQADEAFYPLKLVYDGHAIINFNAAGIGRGETVVMAIAYEKTVEIIGRLMPDLGRVIIVGNHIAEQKANISSMLSEILGRKSEDWSQAFAYEDLLRQASKLEPRDVIIYSPMHKDKTGASFTPYDVAKELSAASKAPVFTSFDALLGSGVVGGHLWSGELLGKRLIETAYVPTLSWAQEDFYYYGFDKTALARFGMKRGPIPDGAILLDGTRIDRKSWKDSLTDLLH